MQVQSTARCSHAEACRDVLHTGDRTQHERVITARPVLQGWPDLTEAKPGNEVGQLALACHIHVHVSSQAATQRVLHAARTLYYVRTGA